MDHDEAVRLYGPWVARTPRDVADLLEGYPGRWWIAGGYAVEAFSGVGRPHGDLDPSIPRSDVPLLCEHLSGVLDVWSADSGTFRPLVGADTMIASTCENLWLRASGASPWEYDVILMDTSPTTPTTPATWTFKRDHRISRALDDILWTVDGTDFLRPEVQLLHKARGLRPQDQADFEACVPRLDDAARSWLVESLDLAHPGHPWSRRLRPDLP